MAENNSISEVSISPVENELNQILEPSSQSSFSRLREDQYEYIDFEKVVCQRIHSILVFSKTEQQFYKYNTKSPLGDSYLCTNETCSVRLYVVTGNKCIRLKNCHGHEHENKTDEYKKLMCLNEI